VSTEDCKQLIGMFPKACSFAKRSIDHHIGSLVSWLHKLIKYLSLFLYIYELHRIYSFNLRCGTFVRLNQKCLRMNSVIRCPQESTCMGMNHERNEWQLHWVHSISLWSFFSWGFFFSWIFYLKEHEHLLKNVIGRIPIKYHLNLNYRVK